ncbi:MAG: hypothetical protein H6650_15415 [Ardenticatenales bacterium]|nr:hypothetical protein [Ardenticatenales bacterium]
MRHCQLKSFAILPRFAVLCLMGGLLLLVSGCRRMEAPLPTRVPLAQVPTETTAPPTEVVLPTSLAPESATATVAAAATTVEATATVMAATTTSVTEEATATEPIVVTDLPPTNTPMPATATRQPTATRLPLPTITPVPPRATRTPLPTSTPPPTVVPSATPVPAGWQAAYYNNRDLSGSPALTRVDAGVVFDWGGGAPAEGLPADNFSARWQREVTTDAGLYRFAVVADDGVRVWLDDQVIIDQWHDAGNQTYSVERNLGAGIHRLRVDYYENQGTARIQFWYEKSSDFPQWRGEYFNNRDVSGSPVLVRNDAQISFNWGTGAPVPDLPADGFSVRWTRPLALDAGSYRFYARADDGVRVWLDGTLILDEWHDTGNVAYGVDRTVNAGNHTLRVEFYENLGSANIQFWWDRTDLVGEWWGEYFDNPTLSGAAVRTRNDANLDFDWGQGAPDAGLPADNFSVRWTRSAQFENGLYRFTLLVDDGARVYLNGDLIIDEWRDGSSRQVQVDRNVNGGAFPVRVEYYDRSVTARVRLTWEKVGPPGTYPDWKAEFFPNQNLEGGPILTRNDADVDFNWGLNAPAPGLPGDGFSVRWTRTLDFDAGTYRLNVIADDGVRVYVDGKSVIDQWRDGSGNRTFSAELALDGEHQIVIAYYDHLFDAKIKFWYERVGQ